MGDTLSKPIESGPILQNKENKPPRKRSVMKIQSPELKVNFNYIKPVSIDMEEMPDDQVLHTVDYSSRSLRTGTIAMPSETIFSLAHAQQIKVRWNSFAKMKHRDYQSDYEVIRKLGRGGFGVVSKVKSIHTQVIRAAKVIKKKQLKENDHKKLLEQLTIMRSLDHPNIIKIYEVYDFEDQYTLILELMSGGQLYKKVKGKKLSQKMARVYMRQIIRTLIYLHSQGIAHRDLKPQNMLFQSEGSNVLKIIDFGIAARISSDQYLTDRIGTPYFIAPQVVYKKYNEKCDIWSAGVIFYMMLTGGMPFKADNEVNLLQAILRQEPKFTGSTWEKYSPQCVELVKLMLQKKPDKRPSASQIFNHRWFSMDETGTQMVKDEKSQEILTNIRKFNFSNKLQAVVHTFIASQLLTNEEKSILVQIFKELDLNNDGVISTEELKQALEKKKKISLERVEFLLNVIDTNCSGEIQYTEFLVAGLSSDQFMKREHFQKAFAYFDIDHSGTITYEEVVEFLENYEQSEEEIQIMFKQVDSNGDGQIDQQEFIKLFINRTSQLKLLYNPSVDQVVSTSKEIQPTLKQKRKALISQRDLNDIHVDLVRQVA